MDRNGQKLTEMDRNEEGKNIHKRTIVDKNGQKQAEADKMYRNGQKTTETNSSR